MNARAQRRSNRPEGLEYRILRGSFMEIQLWREMLDPYELAVKELVLKLEHLIEEYRLKGMYSPIEQVKGRVKSIASILEKAQRKKIPFDNLETEMEDIAGIRIICQFEEDIERVAQILRSRSDMTVKSVKDYLTNAKPSGYRSYHLIIYYTVETVNGPKRLQMEVQIRTLAMNFWATIEHSLQYKYKENIPEYVRKRLSSAAEAIGMLDKEMSSVRSEIIDAQNSSHMQAHLVVEILNNIQNLYKVANKRDIIKIQDEFYRIYAQEDLDQLTQFHKELDAIAEGYRAQGL